MESLARGHGLNLNLVFCFLILIVLWIAASLSLSICMHFFNPVYFRYDVIKNKLTNYASNLIHIDVSIKIILAKSYSKRFLLFFGFFRTFSQSMYKISRILIICLWKRKNEELLRKNRPKLLKQTSWKSNEIWPPWKSNSRPFNQGRINILTNTFYVTFCTK